MLVGTAFLQFALFLNFSLECCAEQPSTLFPLSSDLCIYRVLVMMEKHGAAKSNSQECFKNLQVVRFYDDLAPYWLNFTDRYHT